METANCEGVFPTCSHVPFASVGYSRLHDELTDKNLTQSAVMFGANITSFLTFISTHRRSRKVRRSLRSPRSSKLFALSLSHPGTRFP